MDAPEKMSEGRFRAWVIENFAKQDCHNQETDLAVSDLEKQKTKLNGLKNEHPLIRICREAIEFARGK